MSNELNAGPTGRNSGKSNGSTPPLTCSEAARIADLDREARELLQPSLIPSFL